MKSLGWRQPSESTGNRREKLNNHRTYLRNSPTERQRLIKHENQTFGMWKMSREMKVYLSHSDRHKQISAYEENHGNLHDEFSILRLLSMSGGLQTCFQQLGASVLLQIDSNVLLNWNMWHLFFQASERYHHFDHFFINKNEPEWTNACFWTFSMKYHVNIMPYANGNEVPWYICNIAITKPCNYHLITEWSIIFRQVSGYKFEVSHLSMWPHKRRADVACPVEARIIRVQALDCNVWRCLKNKLIFNFKPIHFHWEKPSNEDHSKILSSKWLTGHIWSIYWF